MQQGNVKVIILAAGAGKRFDQKNSTLNSIPKCLVKIEGNKTILDINIENILTYPMVSEILIVTGFKGELINHHIRLAYRNEAKIKTIFNARFRESVVFSAKLAFDTIANEKSVLLINGDTVFSIGTFEKVWEVLGKNTDSITLFGDSKGEFYADDMKVYVKNNKMENVGKTIRNANAVSSGAILLCNGGLEKYLDTLHTKPVEKLKMHHGILQLIRDSGYEIDFFNLGGRKWDEIDTQTDLNRAQNRLHRIYKV